MTGEHDDASARNGGWPVRCAAGEVASRPPGAVEGCQVEKMVAMSAPVRHVGDAERRARIAQRHGVAPNSRLSDPVAATEAMTVLHATEPATVYLSLQARIDAMTVDDVDRALYVDRRLVKQLAMRRTLFVFPRDLLPAAWGSASARIAPSLAARLATEVERAGLARDGAAWLSAARDGVLARLADGSELSAAQLREEVPALSGRLDLAPGKSYNANTPISPRVLTQLAVETQIVRGRNGGHWRVSRPQWTLMDAWLGGKPEPWPAEVGYAELVRRWLWTFGPGTAADIQWWLGGTAGIVKQALNDVRAVAVNLEDGAIGYLLPEDVEPMPSDSPWCSQPWAALLPVLDPTVMGWKKRDFILGPHGSALFDANGNAGTTAWWNGRIVGGWIQDRDARVRVVLLEDIGAEGAAALDRQAARLTEWLDGVTVGTVYPSPLMKAAKL
ncbi:MAG: winged helix DNA-binding domain-containing protein [Nocardioides sp.]